MKILFYIFFVAIIASACKNNIDTRLTISDDVFTIPIKQDIVNYSINYKSKILRPYWSCYCNFMHTYDSSDHWFYITDLEVEFQSYIYDPKIKFYKPGFTFIGLKKINKNYNAFVIIWINKIQNANIYLKKSNTILDISNNIDATTDTIFTSLSRTTINHLFPSFNGNYIKLELDSISLPDIDPDKYEFYDKITFHNFKLGIGVKS